MLDDKASRIPREIYSFFTGPGGHSLILRGNAGTGKTTFALQTIEDLSAVEKSYYFSTRVSDASLLAQFPWLEDKLEYVRKDPAPAPAANKAEDDASEREGLNGLKGIFTRRAPAGSKGEMSVSIGKDLSELEEMYAAVESRLPERSLVVIDSIDALADRYGISCVKLITVIQKDVVERYGANVMAVLENQDQQLDYLGDAVVKLSLSDHHRRRIREIEILKLRGCEIQQPKYLYSLKGGRIQSFSYKWERESYSGPWTVVPDAGERISTGITDLDAMLFGGIEKGSIVLIELGTGVPMPVAGTIETSLVANFVSQGRGVIWVPLRKASAESAKARVTAMLPKERFDRQVKIPELAATLDTSAGGCVMPVEGSTAAADLKWQTLAYMLQGATMPFLSLIGFDTIESIYGAQVMDQLTDHLASIRRNKGVFVGITSPSTSSTQRLADLATTHLKVERIGGTVVIYGEEPFTECNAISLKDQPKGGKVALTPLV
jgi:KaiC/GvpD/RAD55 family RecA-like ATPase